MYKPEKQTASLEDWRILYSGNEPMYLLGVCKDHPTLPLGDKPMLVRTSLVESVDFTKKVAITKNTVYILKTPYKEGGEFDKLTKELGYENMEISF